MADKTSNANGFAGDPQRRMAAATATGMILRPIMYF
jgi:hypothetical protein